jgi:alkanesulfonate monooxygenase SsuD/methylene tetrahydromethanopterin reductase-like flavin-dependent oxidoreductase (luciferase family)
MWSDDEGPFEGKHYHLARTLNSPQPLARPRPPILIGGGGEKKTLRLVAQYADSCNIGFYDPAAAAHKLDVLRQHCADVGRDYDAIEKTAQTRSDLGENGEPGERTIEQLHYAACSASPSPTAPAPRQRCASPDLFIERIIPALAPAASPAGFPATRFRYIVIARRMAAAHPTYAPKSSAHAAARAGTSGEVAQVEQAVAIVKNARQAPPLARRPVTKGNRASIQHHPPPRKASGTGGGSRPGPSRSRRCRESPPAGARAGRL